jgi:hypothetical protein
MRASFLAAALLLAAAPLMAQRVSGVVRDSASGRGLPGAVVILTSARDETLARTLSDADGRYSLPLAPSAARLRVLRLGYRPRVRELPAAGTAGNLTLDVALFPVPTLLSAVSVIEQPSCPRTDDGQAAMSLWEQSRAALLASVVAREAKPALVTNLTYERALRPNDSLVVYQRVRSRSGQSSRSFVAPRAPEEMNRTGYIETGAAGLRFDIPDADVLLDDSFAATHCFHVSRDDNEHVGEVGLSFEPAPHRDQLVDVRGVLWLDPNAPALRSLEFRYTHLDPAAIDAGAGGTIHFKTMSNGVVAISDWMVMLPALEESRGTRRSLAPGTNGSPQVRTRRQITKRVVQLSETGGVLLNAKWPDSVEWRAPMATIVGRVRTEGAGDPLSHTLITIAGTADSAVTDSSGRFEFPAMLPGRYAFQGTDTSFSFVATARSSAHDASIAPGGTATLDFTLPSRETVLAKACSAGDARSTSAASEPSAAGARDQSVLLGRVVLPTGTPTAGLQLTGRWQADYVLGAATAIREDGGTMDLDASGRFMLCRVARLRPVMLQLSKAFTRLADTLVVVPGDSTFVSVEWHPVVTTAMLADAAPATFRGTVRRASDQAPLDGVDVWLPALGRRTITDSTGEFRFRDLPSGPTLVQVRRVGFLVERDTLTLVRGQEARRDYVLNAQATLLDTVRTIADRTKYVSSRLQQFEDRRARGEGHFIAEDVFRANDERNLTSVLLSRVPGISMVPAARGGGAFLVSTRKACSGAQLLGCKPCFVSIFLDGALLYDASTSNGTPPPDATRFRNAELAGAEYYGDGASAPAQFNRTSSGCGTLLLWTRER